MLYAQVNIELLRKTEPTRGMFGAANLEMSIQTGNVDLTLIESAGRIHYLGEKIETFVLGRTSYGFEDGERIDDKGLLHWRYGYRSSPLLFPEFFLQFNYDKTRLLNARGLAGIGMRAAIIRGSVWKAYLGSSYMLELEKFDLKAEAEHPDRISHHRWSSYFSISMRIDARTAVALIAYVQPRFDDFRDVRFLNNLRIETRLLGPVSLSTTFSSLYDSRPPDSVDSFDTALKSGLAVAW